MKEYEYITGNKKVDEDYNESEGSSDGHMSGDDNLKINLKDIRSLAAQNNKSEEYKLLQNKKLEPDPTGSARSSNYSNSSAVSNSDNRATKINTI